MKNILIAGGAGFIGSHLCERLLQEGNKVVCLDNFSTGHLDNVSALIKKPYFKLIEHDITRSPYHIPTGHIDEIYNLACPASPIHVNPHGIRSCYDEGKRCAESLCMDYHRKYKIPIKSFWLSLF